jgi:alanine racemase
MDGPLSVRQLAHRLELSPATVSRVLNRRPGVSDQTRQRVMAAVREFGWPGQPAPGRDSPLVGIIVPELDNPIFALLAMALENKLGKYGVTALIGSSNLLGFNETDYVDALLSHGVRGLVMVSGWHASTHGDADYSVYRRLVAQGVRLVLVNGQVPGLTVPVVHTDEMKAARLAVAHLQALGHRRIGLANGEAYFRPSMNRLQGFRDALAGSPGGLDERLCAESTYTAEGGRAAARQLLAHGVTAIVAGSDLMALGTIDVLIERGLRVPEDVSVIGYDDSYLAALTRPGLTTVSQPLEKMSTAVVGAMWQQLQGYRVAHQYHVLEPTLVSRASTGPPPPS